MTARINEDPERGIDSDWIFFLYFLRESLDKDVRIGSEAFIAKNKEAVL